MSSHLPLYWRKSGSDRKHEAEVKTTRQARGQSIWNTAQYRPISNFKECEKQAGWKPGCPITKWNGSALELHTEVANYCFAHFWMNESFWGRGSGWDWDNWMQPIRTPVRGNVKVQVLQVILGSVVHCFNIHTFRVGVCVCVCECFVSIWLFSLIVLVSVDCGCAGMVGSYGSDMT